MIAGANLFELDEPTIHLDVGSSGRRWRHARGVGRHSRVISHDRYFLDRIVDRIVDVGDGDARAYEGELPFGLVRARALEAAPRRVGSALLASPPRVSRTRGGLIPCCRRAVCSSSLCSSRSLCPRSRRQVCSRATTCPTQREARSRTIAGRPSTGRSRPGVRVDLPEARLRGAARPTAPTSTCSTRSTASTSSRGSRSPSRARSTRPASRARHVFLIRIPDHAITGDQPDRLGAGRRHAPRRVRPAAAAADGIHPRRHESASATRAASRSSSAPFRSDLHHEHVPSSALRGLPDTLQARRTSPSRSVFTTQSVTPTARAGAGPDQGLDAGSGGLPSSARRRRAHGVPAREHQLDPLLAADRAPHRRSRLVPDGNAVPVALSRAASAQYAYGGYDSPDYEPPVR